MGIFPNNIVAAAMTAHVQYKIIFASVQLAQWALESNYGKSEPAGSNNPFGIKAIPGHDFVECPTHEYSNGRYIKIMAKFAKFASVYDAFAAHAQLLATSGYYSKARHENDPRAFARDLAGVYATDPKYGEKLIAIMDAANLYRWDAASAPPYEMPRIEEPPRKGLWQTLRDAL